MSDDPGTRTAAWTTVAEFYSATAPDYKRLWAQELMTVSPALLDALPLEGARAVLDGGTGVGTLMPEIERRAPDAFIAGIDIAEGMLRLVGGGFPVAVMDLTSLAWAPATFDVATMVFVLFHIPEPVSALEEFGRVLRPGGTLGTLTWGDDPSYPALEVWNGELDAAGAPPAESLSRHELVDTPDKVRMLLDRAGFVDIEAWTGRYENRMTLETFLEHRTGHGQTRRRLETLDHDARARLLKRGQARLEELGPEDFVDRAEVIYARARMPGMYR